MVIDGTRQDPDWKNGDYTTQPRAALHIATDFLLIAGSAPPCRKTIQPETRPTPTLTSS